MPAEHLGIDGKLRQGYFCPRCGGSTNMYNSHNGLCEYRPEVVKKLRHINDAGSIEEYIFRKLKGEYNE